MRNFKKTAPALLVLLALVMSSCFNIMEEITLKKEGSGHYKMSVDMSQMKEMMAMLKGMGQDSTGGAQPEMQAEQIGQSFTQIADVLKGVRGLTNQTAISDTTNYVFGYEFDFADVDALNRAIKKVGEQGENGGKDVPDAVFSLKKGKFERQEAKGGMVDEMKKALFGGDAGADAEQVKMILGDMTVTTTYHFPDQKVDKQDHGLGQVSEDGRTVSIEQKPFADGADPKKMGAGIKIKLK